MCSSILTSDASEDRRELVVHVREMVFRFMPRSH